MPLVITIESVHREARHFADLRDLMQNYYAIYPADHLMFPLRAYIQETMLRQFCEFHAVLPFELAWEMLINHWGRMFGSSTLPCEASPREHTYSRSAFRKKSTLFAGSTSHTINLAGMFSPLGKEAEPPLIEPPDTARYFAMHLPQPRMSELTVLVCTTTASSST